GNNEFSPTGNIKDWNRVPDLPRISQPALVMCGEHDHLTPACSQLMHDALPDSRIKVLTGASHLSMWEVPDAYFELLMNFLDGQRA
ncbi:MAG TPA: proline iminopeptidase, partial [Alphaproteobacteria bacterium]|nr:proline iminopeptidase [Alphaproteobacteria bacterium]